MPLCWSCRTRDNPKTCGGLPPPARGPLPVRWRPARAAWDMAANLGPGRPREAHLARCIGSETARPSPVRSNSKTAPSAYRSALLWSWFYAPGIFINASRRRLARCCSVLCDLIASLIDPSPGPR